MRNLEVFRLICVSRLTDFNEICLKEGDGGSPKADQIWRCCVNIWGYTVPKICIKTTVFAPQGYTIHPNPTESGTFPKIVFTRKNALSNFSKMFELHYKMASHLSWN